MTDSPLLPAHATLLREAIETLVAEFVETGRAESPEAINCGECVDFAEALQDRLPGTPLSAYPGAVLQFEDFCADEDGEPGDIRRDAVAREPGFVPPPGLDWCTLDRWRIGECVVHAWLSVAGRHYDSETPEGVDNPFDLPCIRSTVLAVGENEEPGRVEALSELPWWRETREIVARRDAALKPSSPAP